MAVDREWYQQLHKGQIVEHRYGIVFPDAEVEIGGELMRAAINNLGQPILSHDCPLIEAGDTRVLVMPPVIQGSEIIVRLFVGFGQTPEHGNTDRLDDIEGVYTETDEYDT